MGPLMGPRTVKFPKEGPHLSRFEDRKKEWKKENKKERKKQRKVEKSNKKERDLKLPDFMEVNHDFTDFLWK